MSLDGVRSEAFLTHSGVVHSEPTCMIVEDQMLIGLSLEAYLEDMGFGACPMFRSSAEALVWLATNTPTVAILDYSLREGPCTKLVRALRKRDIPFLIYSGQKRSVAPREFQDVPWIIKPCDREVLLAALTRIAPAVLAWSTQIRA